MADQNNASRSKWNGCRRYRELLPKSLLHSSFIPLSNLNETQGILFCSELFIETLNHKRMLFEHKVIKSNYGLRYAAMLLLLGMAKCPTPCNHICCRFDVVFSYRSLFLVSLLSFCFPRHHENEIQLKVSIGQEASCCICIIYI